MGLVAGHVTGQGPVQAALDDFASAPLAVEKIYDSASVDELAMARAMRAQMARLEGDPAFLLSRWIRSNLLFKQLSGLISIAQELCRATILLGTGPQAGRQTASSARAWRRRWGGCRGQLAT